jgi:hypothetical protein
VRAGTLRLRLPNAEHLRQSQLLRSFAVGADRTAAEAPTEIMGSRGRSGTSAGGILPDRRCPHRDSLGQRSCRKFIGDGEARNLNAESLKKMRDAMARLFLACCTKQGYRLLKQLGVDEIREFRNSLMKRYAASSAQTRLECVRSFLRFCQASGWISANPAVTVKPPRSQSSPTLPFEEAEIEKMLAAAETFTTNGNFGAGTRTLRSRRSTIARG